jgi:hypothetical protein
MSDSLRLGGELLEDLGRAALLPLRGPSAHESMGMSLAIRIRL